MRYNKNKILLAACCLFLGVAPTAAAANIELANIKADLDGNGTQETVTLWGDALKNGYASNLLVTVKSDKGRLLTSFAPTVNGGYNCLLQSVKLYSPGRQVLLSAGQGDWDSGSEFRVLDFSDLSNVKEVFGAAEAVGIIQKAAFKDHYRLEVTMANGDANEVKVNENRLAGMYDENGRLTGPRQAEYGGLYSLTAADIDNDGWDELLTTQKILTPSGVHLSDAGAVWQYDKEKGWQRSAYTMMLAADVQADNRVNDGFNGETYSILPRKIVFPFGEATYPVAAYPGKTALQNDVNKILNAETKEYLEQVYRGEADMAFRIITAEANLLSIQLVSGKKEYRHHYVNIAPESGKRLGINDLLDTEAKDLPLLLNLLSNNKNIDFTSGIPNEWYIYEDKIFFMERICGQEETAGFAIGNLHKFLKDKKWLRRLN